jgi:hypothetical protein
LKTAPFENGIVLGLGVRDMLAGQTLARRMGDGFSLRPACPNCGRSMHMTRMTPGTDGLPDLGTFRCGECGVWVTEAAGDQFGQPH